MFFHCIMFLNVAAFSQNTSGQLAVSGLCCSITVVLHFNSFEICCKSIKHYVNLLNARKVINKDSLKVVSATFLLVCFLGLNESTC